MVDDVDSKTLVADLRKRIVDGAKKQYCSDPGSSQAAAFEGMSWETDMALIAGCRILSKEADPISVFVANNAGEVTLCAVPKSVKARDAWPRCTKGNGEKSSTAQLTSTPTPGATPTASSLPSPGVTPTSAELAVMIKRMQTDAAFADEVMQRALADHDFATVWLRHVSSNPESMGIAMNLMQTNPRVMAASQQLMANDPSGVMRGFAGAGGAPGVCAATPQAVPTQPARVRYADALKELASMGFEDEEASLIALEQTGGDISGAVDILAA